MHGKIIATKGKVHWLRADEMMYCNWVDGVEDLMLSRAIGTDFLRDLMKVCITESGQRITLANWTCKVRMHIKLYMTEN